MYTLLTVLALAAICANAQTIGSRTFTANVTIREPGMLNAYQSGYISYDYTKQRMRLDYIGVAFFELSTWQGATGQFVYKSGAACKSTCETTALNYTMPPFFINGSTFYTQSGWEVVGGVNYTVYVRVSASNAVVNMLVLNNQIKYIRMASGREYTLTTYTTPGSTQQDSNFVSPSGCSCGNRLDISVVVDRSGSIRRDGEWNYVVDFVNALINKMTFGSTGIYLGISSFNHDTWVTLPMAQGTTQANAIGSMAKMNYCIGGDPNFDPIIYQQCNNHAGATEVNPCCEGYTCLQCAVQQGIQQLQASPRFSDPIDKVMIVITDGTANVQPTAAFNTVGPTCAGPSGNGLSRTSTWAQVTPRAINQSTGQCWLQIYNELQASKAVVPRLNLFSIGIGTNEISNLELEVLAGGDPTHRFTASNFSLLSTIIDRVVAAVCIPQEKPCGDCCGFCICGTCTKPTSCDPPQPCTIPVAHDTCCFTNNVSAAVACSAQNCKITACYPNTTANGGCVYTNDTRCNSFSDVCETFTCSATNGGCVKIWDNPQCYNQCANNSECGNDPCKNYLCYNITLYDNVTNTSRFVSRCSSSDKVCNNSNPCAPQFCNSSGLCQTTPVLCDQRKPPECWNGVCYNGTCNWTELTGATCSNQCVNASDCVDSDLCTAEACAPVANGTKCTSNPIPCADLDNCHKKRCLPSTGCQWENVTCPADDPNNCFTWACDMQDGVCRKTINIACVDKCVDDLSCFLDLCQDSKCVLQGQAKACNHTAKVCAPADCASVVCDPQLGCVYTNHSASYCDDYNNCTIDSCVEGTGCVHTNATCPGAGADPCTIVQCDPFIGCFSYARDCPRERVCQEEKGFYDDHHVQWKIYKQGPQTSNYPTPYCDMDKRSQGLCNCTVVDLFGCSIAYCNTTTGQCREVEQPCAESPPFITAVTGGLIGAGAIVGIVCGIILCVAFAGGGSYAYYDATHGDNQHDIKNNPLYEDNCKGGANPLHDGH